MFLDVIKDGKFSHSVKADSGGIAKPSIILKDGEYMCSGDIEELRNMGKLYLELSNMMLDASRLTIIPLYKRLCAEDCKFIIDIAENSSNKYILEDIIPVFNTDKLYTWLDELRCREVL